MDDRRKRRLQWGVALASVVLPLAIVVLSLPYHGGLWLLLALAGGAAASIVLVELGERSDARAKPENTYLPGSLRLLEIQSADAGPEQGTRSD
jgi:hypothetical protein